MANEKQQPSSSELIAQIEELQKKLAHETVKRTEAEQMAAAMAEANSFSGGNAEEQPTGNKIKVRKCANPAERDEKKQKWVELDVPTYFYHVELPAGAGLSLMTNGMEYFHGQTYEVDHDTLVDLKSRVARTWDHEKSIHSENENAYRRPTNVHLKSRAAIQHGY